MEPSPSRPPARSRAPSAAFTKSTHTCNAVPYRQSTQKIPLHSLALMIQLTPNHPPTSCAPQSRVPFATQHHHRRPHTLMPVLTTYPRGSRRYYRFGTFVPTVPLFTFNTFLAANLFHPITLFLQPQRTSTMHLVLRSVQTLVYVRCQLGRGRVSHRSPSKISTCVLTSRAHSPLRTLR